MAADSAEPPAREEPHSSGQSSGSGGEQRNQPDARKPPSERFGELSILRTSKDDGRALIIYSHEEHDEHESHDEHEERERT
jgi:hypothetical protein